MRYLVLSDIHANLEALDTCLAHAREKGFDKALILGDLVGYGADPNAVISCIQELEPLAMIRGNHDKIALNLSEADDFNVTARSAARWTYGALTDANRTWLAALPQGPVAVDDLVEICHGSPFDVDAYIFDELDALRGLRAASRPLCLFGHTHSPVTFYLTGGRLGADSPGTNGETALTIEDDVHYLLNPGSVGQPRDGDPRAAYAIVDVDAKRVELFRLLYPVEVAQEKIVKAGLPEVLARRLASGR
jgi:diadenosine tetraphosphatase ApaH/serine/threonine PP2A family protein phosphatase